jgi:hypothetical protein
MGQSLIFATSRGGDCVALTTSLSIARQPVATLKTVTTHSAVSAAVVKMTAQIQ